MADCSPEYVDYYYDDNATGLVKKCSADQKAKVDVVAAKVEEDLSKMNAKSELSAVVLNADVSDGIEVLSTDDASEEKSEKVIAPVDVNNCAKQSRILRNLVLKINRWRERAIREDEEWGRDSVNIRFFRHKMEQKKKEMEELNNVLQLKEWEISEKKMPSSYYCELTIQMKNEISMLVDEYEMRKKAALDGLFKANEKILSVIDDLFDEQHEIVLKLRQRWRLFGKRKLRNKYNNVFNTKEELKVISQKICEEIDFLNDFQLSQK